MKTYYSVKKFGIAMTALLLAGALYGASGKTLSDVGTTGISGEPNVGLIARGDGTYALVFTNAQTTTFTFNSMWTVKEFLVVGGGGAGGGNGGGGGGGGGVIYFGNDLVVADGVKTDFGNNDSISLTVGAGGTGAFKMTGMPGGHSTLKLGDKTYTAFGGGGGGNYKEAPSTSQDPMPGAGGNTGCGAGQYRSDKDRPGDSTTMPDLPGYYGTNGGAGNGSACGGGGGAGAAGGGAPTSSKGGDGGDGLKCLITGSEVYYAAGGGGGDTSTSKDSSSRAAGGMGGGGRGSHNIGRLTPNDTTKAPAEANATGFGCGGGGGMGGGGMTCVGGNGSAGIVVLLIEPIEIIAEKPLVSVLVPERGANYVKFSVSVVADGLDNTTTSEVWGGWSKNADEIVCAKLADAVAVNGSVTKTLTGLEVGETYSYRFYAVNGNSVEGDVVEGSFTLDAGGIDPAGAAPVVTNQACTVLGTSVNIPYCVAWPGAGKETCSVSLKYGLMEDRLSYTVDLGAGLIGNNSAQIAGLIPGRRYFFQLTADNGDARGSSEVFNAIIGDDEVFPTEFDARQPVIAGVGGSAGFVAGGDGMVYSGTFTNYVAGTVVTFHYSPDGGETWLADVATVTDEGFSGAVGSGLTPATDVPYYFTAEADEFADCTQVRVFNTKSVGNIQYEITLHNGTATRTLGMTDNVSDIGAGTNSVVCLIAKVKGAEDDAWFDLALRPIFSPNPNFRIDCTSEEVAKLDYGTTYIVTMAIRSTSFGGQTWEARARDREFTPQENTVYTWKDGNDGFWDDPQNWLWTPDGAHKTESVAGYPVYGATAQFESGAAATVQIRRAERVKSLLIGGADVTLSFVIPLDGLAEPMVSIYNPNEAFPAEGANPVTVTVASKSGFLRRHEPGSQRLISCAGGINTNSVNLLSPRTDTSAFRYGTKLNNGRPTELWLDVEPASNGFLIIVR